MPPDLLSARSKTTGPEPTRHPNLLTSQLRASKLPAFQAQPQPYLSQPHSRDANMATSHSNIVKFPSSRPQGTSQHPSQYPPTALYALHQAGLVASPLSTPRIDLQEDPFGSKAPSPYSSTLASKSRSFDQYRAVIDPRPVPPSKPAAPSTSTISERRTSVSSATSSEFSLSSAFPPSSIPGVSLEQPRRSSTKDKATNAIDSVQVFLHQKVARSGAVRPQQTKTPKAKADNRKDDWDSPSLGTKRSQMKLARRPKTAEGRAAKKTLPLQDSAQTNVVLPGWNDDAEYIKPQPRLRTIALASHKNTQKSPPPPHPIRSTRADIPPSPMTPRPVPRYNAPVTPLVDAVGDSSFGQGSDATLQVARPPRSMKRSPSPMQTAKLHMAAPSIPIQEGQQEEKRSLDYDGVEWEMLDNGRQAQQQAVARDRTNGRRNSSSGSSDKWNSIEKWREYANTTIADAFVGTEEGALKASEAGRCEVTIRENSMASLPTVHSSVSLCPAESFQSMSSIAPSLFFAAMSEVPGTPITRKTQRPSSSPQSPTTTSFADAPLAAQQPSSSVYTRQFHRPSTSIHHEHEASIASTSSFAGPSTGQPVSRSRQHTPQTFPPSAALGRTKRVSPSHRSVASEASEVFQSADEGESSLSPPRLFNKSPREQLYRRYHNAQKRASRLFGRTDPLVKENVAETAASRRQSALHLTTLQLMALSKEAESGRLDTAQWQQRHAQLLTTDEEASPCDDPTSDSIPTPELSRLSAISREGDSPNTPKSPLWQEGDTTEKQQNQQQMQHLGEPRGNIENGIFASQQREPMIKAPTSTLLASPQPPRLVRRRSKRLSTMRCSTDETSQKPVLTFLKLETLPIQLVEAPTPSSWRSTLTEAEYQDFNKTFGSKEMHRQEVIEELSVTEWNFVISMSSLLRVFSVPLRKSDMSFHDNVPLEVARLFNWLDDILAFHVKLLKALDKTRNRHPSALVVCVAGSLCKHIEGLSIHQSYLVNFEKVTTLLEEVRRSSSKGDLSSFDEVIERQSRLPECRGMALSSFLLKPVQRLMKYPLFFKQLAELTPTDHPDYQDTHQLCSLTEKVIRDMNCVKAREEDYQELKLLESRVKGLPEDFHLASRQRRLIKQGVLRSVPLSEMEQVMLQSPQLGIDRNFSFGPVTPPLPNIRPLGLKSSSTSSGLSPSPRLGSNALLLTPDSASASPASHSGPLWSTLPFESSSASTTIAIQPKMLPPPRPTSRKASMANIFSRGQAQSKQGETDDEVTLHAFVFDDLLLLTIMHKEEDKEATKAASKSSKKKSGSQNKLASPSLTPGAEDHTRYTVITRGGLSRILGVTNRMMKSDSMGDSTPALEVEVLPMSMVGESLRSSGSSGTLTFVFSFADEVKGSGIVSAQEILPLWEKAFERSFLNCIQAQRRQTRYAQTDLSSPIFGAINIQRQQSATPTTAQADWLRRRRHVTQMVNNAAKCGDRTTLTALLQAGLPFPRSPSQQNLSDAANRSVAVVERGSPMLPSQEIAKEVPKEAKVIKKSTSQSHLKKSPNLGSFIPSTINVDEIARVGDLGTSSMVSRILDEERREEKTWWSLRLREIEVEAERSDELDRIIESRRTRGVENSTPTAETPTLTRVRRGVPVLKSL